jgi:methylenetetrahydrofolate dehydrogenase (NADP+)/methenyltetrahydrofolate cyclohydrolase
MAENMNNKGNGSASDAIDGRAIAKGILERLSAQPKPEKFLAVVLVGDDPSSVSFIKQKEKIAKQLGVDFRLYRFPVEKTSDELRDEVRKIAEHKTCGGVVVQLPLPAHVNRHYVLNALPPEKDVDVLGERALGAFYAERGRVLPPAVATVEEILKIYYPDAIPSVAVVGLGLLVGRPMATWIMWRARETFLLRSTSDLGLIKQTDIVITGVGKAGLITPRMVKPGAMVIDFGYDSNRGDFEASGAGGADSVGESADGDDEKNIKYTPTPGGTGPILVAKLFENFYKLNKES